jgi:hypothetical protein
MSKTKHLDTAIAILKGSAITKRAKRMAQVEIVVLADGASYTIQMNGKVLEEGAGTVAHAKERAEARADRIRDLGKTCIVTVY